ncbi:MAG: undecaprenyl-diphosphate phosphatase [Thaumarchaeota archaeon]|nr:undecaprenyl-diphosphate phosphatase [Nitrososphaerota archaeon]
MNLLFAVLLGLVQGISEWLPISSKTQVLYASYVLFGLPIAAGYAFGLFMEIGSLASATVYFRKDIISLFHDRRLFTYLLVVTLFTAIVGAPLYYITDKYLQGASPFIGIPMIILGLVLIGIGFYIRYSRSIPKIGGLNEMKLKNYIIVGIAQGIAALPGVSRSGMTVSTMLVMGVKPDQAFRLSYLAYIPASLGAFGVSLLFTPGEINAGIQAVQPLGIAVSIITAALIGIVTISYLLKFAKSSKIWKLDIVLGLIALSIGIVATVFFYLLPNSVSLS